MIQEREFPVLVLGNDQITVTLYVPDEETGYVRGQRFDPSSMVESVKFAGHTIFNSFMDDPDPESMLNATGFAEEFGIEFPPGYLCAEPGEVFLKIGVGILERVSDEPYQFFHTYPTVHRPGWKSERLDSRTVRFSQTLPEVEGWAYQYQRIITLDPGEPVITVQRHLRNDGKRKILTRHYAHNMFAVNGGEVGAGYALVPAFPLPLDPFPHPNDTGHLQRDQNRLQLVKSLEDALFWRFPLLVPEAHHRFHFEHAESGLAMEVAGDSPIEAFALHFHSRAFSAEPFTRVAVEPGETFSWSTVYRFYELSNP